MNTFIHFVLQDSNLFVVQGFAILDILSIQPQTNFHNQSFIKLFELLVFVVLIKRIYFLRGIYRNINAMSKYV